MRRSGWGAARSGGGGGFVLFGLRPRHDAVVGEELQLPLASGGRPLSGVIAQVGVREGHGHPELLVLNVDLEFARAMPRRAEADAALLLRDTAANDRTADLGATAGDLAGASHVRASGSRGTQRVPENARRGPRLLGPTPDG